MLPKPHRPPPEPRPVPGFTGRGGVVDGLVVWVADQGSPEANLALALELLERHEQQKPQ
mgnify:CR=1 FL=1